MKLMSSKKNLLMWLTFNKTKFFFNNIEPKICIKRILGDTKDGQVGAEEIPKPVHLRFGPWTLIASIAHLIDNVSHKSSLLSQDVREGWVNGRFRKGNIIAIAVGTRRTSIIPISPRAQHHSVMNKTVSDREIKDREGYSKERWKDNV